MEMYFHFLRRDLRDSAPSWLTALLAVGCGLILNRFYGFDQMGSSSALYFVSLGICLMGISHPHCRGIWGGRNSAPVPRTYLKELPLKRRHSFWLCFARGIPGDLPIALYVLWALPHFNLLPIFASRLRGFPILPREAHWSEYLLCLGLVTIFIVYSQLSSATYGLLQDGLSRTNDRGRRLASYATMMTLGACVPSILAAGAGWILFCSFFEIPLNTFGWGAAILGLPITVAQFYWLYRTWLWS